MWNNIKESQIEKDDIFLFIDELKSDDPSLKLNACDKLDIISKFLGENRTKTELLPYINHLIEEYDNDEQFLGKVTEKLIEISGNYPNIKFEVFLKIFETLFLFEEDQIRKKSINDFDNFIKKFDNKYINYEALIEVILRWGIFDWIPSKLSSCTLYKYIYQYSNLNNKIKNIFIDFLNSEKIILKRTAIKTLSELIKIGCIKKNDYILNYEKYFENIFEYKNESVIIELITSLLPVIDTLKDKNYIESKLLNKILKINESFSSWRIDYHISEILIKLLKNFKYTTIKEKIIPKFNELLNHEDIEVKSNTLYNFKFLLENIKQNDNTYINIIDKINDNNSYVKINYCETLNNITKEYNINDLKLNIIPNYIKLLKDQKTEIILSVLKNIDNTLKIININIFNEFLKEEFNLLKSHKNWKIRFELLNLINKVKDYSSVNLFFFLLNNDLRNDLVLCIRNKIIDNLIYFTNILEIDIIKRNINIILKDWVDNKNYIFRISALQNFYKLYSNITYYNESDIIEHLELIYNKLKIDKVANVRLNVIKCILEFKNNNNIFNRFLIKIKSDFKEEIDIDVLNVIKTM